MLRLRKILLHNCLYICIFIIVTLISFVRISISKEDSLIQNNKLIGEVKDYYIDGDKLTLLIGKKKVLGTYYIKTKKEKDQLEKIILGDKYEIKGEFYLPKDSKTKGLFNYKRYLKTKKIKYLINIDEINKISDNQNIFYKIKNYIIKRLKNNSYLYTFILGNKSYIKSEIMYSYQENGISHLFAISGMHIQLLSLIILKLLKKLNEEKRYLFTSCFLLFYLSLTGLSPSVLRGVLFFILFSINKVFYFYIKKTNLFLIALSICLLVNPFYIYDIGFIYSFTISFALLLSTNFINDKNYFISLFKTSFISFLASLPISLYTYSQINILSIVYNLFFVPFVSIIIFPLSLASLFCNFLIPFLNIGILMLENISLALNHISFGKLIFFKLNILVYIIYLILIFIMIKSLNNKKKTKFYIIICILVIHYFLPSIMSSTYIKMIYVGQGDSILLHSKNDSILIDTGGVPSFKKENWQKQNKENSIVKSTTIPLLKSLCIKKIKHLIITHGDFDHIGEAYNLIKYFKVENIIINNNKINYLEEKLIKEFKNVTIGEEGLVLKCGDIKLVQLNENLNDENDSSQIYYASYKNKSILFTGDASIKSEELFLKKYDLGKIEILKVGHHGSKTSTGENLLKELKPKIAIMSLGENNKFGHPHQETIERLKKYNIKFFRTDKSGTITINLRKMKLLENKNTKFYPIN